MQPSNVTFTVHNSVYQEHDFDTAACERFSVNDVFKIVEQFSLLTENKMLCAKENILLQFCDTLILDL